MNPTEFISKNKRKTCSCGAPNNCAVEQGKSISACWCYGEVVPLGVLAEMNNEGVCLCRKCLKGGVDGNS